MSEHRHILEAFPKLKLDKNRLRVKYCPCGKSNKDGKFVPYVGYENKGYCHSCGETFLPELPIGNQFINAIQTKSNVNPKTIISQTTQVSFVPVEIFKSSLSNYSGNNFVKYLIGLFGNEITSELIGHYFIGTSNHWNGSTIFWQIDTTGKVRTGKIMLYNPVTGKRVKEPFNHIAWSHNIIKKDKYDLKQCFFGEQFLQVYKTKPVAIAESEKTAIIASLYFPQFIWLAAGSKEGLKNVEKCKVLKGRKVILFPDLGAYDDWVDRAKELSTIANVSLSDLLERKATDEEREQGLDLADYLIRFDHNSFSNFKQPPKPEAAIQEHEPLKRTISIFSTPGDPAPNEFIEGDVPDNFSHIEPGPTIEELPSKVIPDVSPSPDAYSNDNNWDIAALEVFFNSSALPTGSIKLDECTTIVDIPMFLDSHLSIVKVHNGNPTFHPYYDRLIKLTEIFTGKRPNDRPKQYG